MEVVPQPLRAQPVSQGIEHSVEVRHAHSPQEGLRRHVHHVVVSVQHDEHEHDEDGRPHREEEQHETDERFHYLEVTVAASLRGLQCGRGGAGAAG